MNWNRITYKYYYLYKKKTSQIVFVFEEKTPHEYDSGTSWNKYEKIKYYYLIYEYNMNVYHLTFLEKYGILIMHWRGAILENVIRL